MTLVLTVLIAGALFLLFTWVAIIDIARKVFDPPYLKIIWAMFVVLMPFIGCAFYLALGRRQGKVPPRNAAPQETEDPGNP